MGITNALTPPVTGTTWTFTTLPTQGVAHNAEAFTSDAGLCRFSSYTGQWLPVKPKNIAASKRYFNAPGPKNIQQVMATPPTVAISTTNPVTTGQFYGAVNSIQAGVGAPFNIANWALTRTGNPSVAGATNPNFEFAKFTSIQAVGGSNMVGLSVIFSGTVLVLSLKDVSTAINVKVNDQYVSLTPSVTGNTGATSFLSVTFAAPVSGARIDFLVSNVLDSFFFGGMFTGSKTDTLDPAEIRGPRVLVLGDSVTAATGASAQPLGFVNVFAEYMGWDDVWPSGIGGTGLLSGSATEQYLARVQSDIIAFNPDEVIIAGFTNDASNTFTAMFNAANAVVEMIQAALPLCRITFFGPYSSLGVGFQFGTSSGNGFVATRAALNAAVAQANSELVTLIDPTEFNVPNAPFVTTLSAAATTGATTITTAVTLMPGVNYQFADGSKCRCLSSSGATATIDQLVNSQASGATITQTGNAWLTGKGFAGATTGVGNADLYIISDDTHPTNLGHLNLGINLATQYVQNLNA